AEWRQAVRQAPSPRDLLQSEVDRIAIPAAGGEVGAGLLREPGADGVERIEEQHAYPRRPGPAGEAAKVAEVADPPAACRPQGVELQRQSACPQALGEVACSWADDKAYRTPRALRAQPVISGRKVWRQLAF